MALENQALLERCTAGDSAHNELAARFNGLNSKFRDTELGFREMAEENVELRKQIAEITSREWQSNSAAKVCTACNKPFSATRRKHHCRHCGRIFCAACSSKTAKTPASKKEVRVCDECYIALK